MSVSALLFELDGLCGQWAGMFISHILQTSFFLGCALLLSGLLRRHSPALRHFSLLSVFLALPLLPLISGLVEASGLFAGTLALLPASAARIPELLFPAGVTTTELPAASTAVSGTAPSLSLIDFPWLLAAAVLLMGMAVFLIPVAACRLRIIRLRLSGAEVRDPAVTTVFRRAARQLDLSRRFRLIEHPGIAAPFTAGTVRPAVYLPAGFVDGLSPAALHEVALHELAHVRRHDSLTLTMVALLRSLYFWNPLAWIAAQRIARLAEEACDHDVLRLTGNPVRYAKMLTRMAERLPSRRILMESPAGIVFAHTSFRHRIEAILDTGRRRLINRFPRFKLAVFTLLVFFTFAAAAAAPAITAIEEPVPTDDTGSELTQTFNRLEPEMNMEQVKAILGPPDDTVTVSGRANQALVWKQSRFLVTTETVIVAFRDEQAVMLTHSSGPILNVRRHVEEALANNPDQVLAVANQRRIKELERFDGIYEMRNDVAAMLNHIDDSGGEYFEVDPENAARFDGIALGTGYDEIMARLGQPQDVELNWSKTFSTWRWNSDAVTLGFKDQVLISKAFKTTGREALVEEGQWQASAGRTRVTVIED
jgi:beta-lactamase regulating signal transducer with metallopeptidase domain